MWINTADGYRLIGGPLQPTPQIAPWWQFGFLGHMPLMAADDREAIELIRADVIEDANKRRSIDIGQFKRRSSPAQQMHVTRPPSGILP